MMAVKALRSNPNWAIFEKVNQMHSVQTVQQYRRDRVRSTEKNCVVGTQPDDSTAKRTKAGQFRALFGYMRIRYWGRVTQIHCVEVQKSGMWCQKLNRMTPDLML